VSVAKTTGMFLAKKAFVAWMVGPSGRATTAGKRELARVGTPSLS
jgi:hypothetical protein